ncbi:hypothetical protein ACE3K0_23205, partial [Enterobacter hormaechei subsp. xiangfangensis]
QADPLNSSLKPIIMLATGNDNCIAKQWSMSINRGIFPHTAKNRYLRRFTGKGPAFLSRNKLPWKYRFSPSPF